MKPSLIRILSLYIFVSLTSHTIFAQVTWDGGGGDNDWHNALNWDTDLVPTAADNVISNAPTTITIGANAEVLSLTLNSGALIIQGAGALTINAASSIASGTSLTVSGGNITLSGMLTCNGTFHFIDGVVAGSSDLTTNGTAYWEGGTFGNTIDLGQWVVGGGFLSLTGTNDKELAAPLNK